MPLPEPSTWPLLLVGPMVRRVTTTSVAVFVATSKSCDVKLEVWEGVARTPTPLWTATGKTLKFGSNLHALVIEASGAALSVGKVYGYDVTLTTGGVSKTLAGLDLLTGDVPLGYTENALPSFVLPQPLGSLTLLYCSCRKPHGEGPDMLPHVDRLLAASSTDAKLRPQQLMLGGDQIYADDVEAGLRQILTALGGQLLGWTETLPDGKDSNDAALGYDARARYLFDAGFKDFIDLPYTLNHLLFFAEWVAMYCLVWSPVLWPAAYLDAASTGLDVEVMHYARCTARIRRALANIATFMIFDDHEISDDWFLNGQVARRQRGELGRRILRNGLAAYAIFQDWGNQPSDYKVGTKGEALLAKLTVTSGTSPELATVPTKADDLLDCGRTAQALPGLTRKLWHYTFEGPGHRVLVLDTRTWRSFPGANNSPPELIGLLALTQQVAGLGSLGGRQVLVVSAAPVLGHSVVEMAQQLRIDAGLAEQIAADHNDPAHVWVDPYENWDNEPWSGNARGIQQLFALLQACCPVVFLSGDVHYSFTSYADYGKMGGAASRYVQCCSSAAKNAELKTKLATLLSLVEPGADPKWFLATSWSVIGPDMEKVLAAPKSKFEAAIEEAQRTASDATDRAGQWLQQYIDWREVADLPFGDLGLPERLTFSNTPLSVIRRLLELLGLDPAVQIMVGVTGVEDVRDPTKADIGPCGTPNPLPLHADKAPTSLPSSTAAAAKLRELGTIGTPNIGVIRFQECGGTRWLIHDILWTPLRLLGKEAQSDTPTVLSTQYRVVLANPSTLGGSTP